MKIKCSYCKKTFKPGNKPDGSPNGVAFVDKNGKVINMCHDCICKVGSGELKIDGKN